jgi:hypothetical protein
MDIVQSSFSHAFTRLHARITQENGAFTVSIRMLNHLKPDDRGWGKETASSVEMASTMIGQLAAQFSIPQSAISIKFVMENFRDGTQH